AKKSLIQWHRENIFKEIQIDTSRGFLIPIQQARKKFAIKIIKPNNPQFELF
ncbi:unnamed protein product, partial [marine sediment metagenome]